MNKDEAFLGGHDLPTLRKLQIIFRATAEQHKDSNPQVAMMGSATADVLAAYIDIIENGEGTATQ